MILQPFGVPDAGGGSGIARGERVAENSVVGSVILHERVVGRRRKSPGTWDVCLPAGGCQTPPRPSIRVLAGCERWSLSSHRHESSQAWPPRMRGFKGRPWSCLLKRGEDTEGEEGGGGTREMARALLGICVVYTGQRAGRGGSWEGEGCGGEDKGSLEGGGGGGVKRGRGWKRGRGRMVVGWGEREREREGGPPPFAPLGRGSARQLTHYLNLHRGRCTK